MGKRLGQPWRATLTYDAAIWALLLLALSRPEKQVLQPSHCLIHPFRKHAILQEHPILTAAADLSLVLLRYHVEDQIRDRERVLLARGVHKCSRAPWEKIQERHQNALQQFEQELERLHDLEQLQRPKPEQMGLCNARASIVLTQSFLQQDLRMQAYWPEWIWEKYDLFVEQVSELVGTLGQWVYFVDACEDWESDRKNGRPNPFSSLSDGESVWRAGDLFLVESERVLVHGGAQLPWQQYEGMIANLFRKGLPFVREMLRQGKTLPKL